MNKPILKLCFLIAVGLPVLPVRISGQTPLVWDGEGGDGQWCNSANWEANSLPGSLDTGIFTTADPDHTTVTVGCNHTFGRIRLANQGSISRTVQIGPDETVDRTLTFSGILVENVTHENIYPGVNMVFSGAPNAHGKKLKININRRIRAEDPGPGGSKNMGVASTDCSLTLSCDISGDQGIVKAGVGPLILSGQNTHTGTNLIAQGSIRMGHPQALGHGGLNLGPVDGGTLVRTFTTLDLGGQTNINEVITLNGNGLGTKLGGALINSSSNLASIAAGVLSTVTVVTGGTGYVSPPEVNFSGGGGSGAAATVTLGLTTQSITLTAGGSGYTDVPQVNISGGGGSDARAIATLSGGVVTSITITSPGHGYASAPNISFSGGGGGTGATASGNANNFTVVGATVTSVGSGYTTAPTVNLSGGGGSGAAAMANLSSVILATDSTVGGAGTIDIGGIVSGSGGLKKQREGTLILSAANAYTGNTTVTNGTLLVHGSLAPASAVTVLGGLLGGNGSIGGSVTVNGGGTISGGASAGILTLNNGLNLSGGGNNVWELAANSTSNPGVDFDQLVMTGGSLVLGGSSSLSLQFIGTASAPDSGNAFWQSPRSWTIIAANGAASNFTYIENGSYPAGTFSTSVEPGGIVLTFTPGGPPTVMAPEITTILGAGTTNVTVTWTNALVGTNYVLQYNTDLTTTNWTSLTPVTALGATAFQTDNPPVGDAQRYYRVVTQ